MSYNMVVYFQTGIHTNTYLYLKIVFIGKSEMILFEQDSIMMTAVAWENLLCLRSWGLKESPMPKGSGAPQSVWFVWEAKVRQYKWKYPKVVK